MDYKEKYKKALEWMKSIYPTMQGSDKEDAEHYFPELAESEDEKMINGLQGFLSAFGSDYFGTDGWQKFDDWLEKQKEQKPADGKELLYVSNKSYNIGYRDGKREAEQKPAEWSEDYRNEDLRTRFAFYTYKDEDDVLYLSNVFVEETSRNKGFGTKILTAAEKVAETIGAINIRLKVKQDSPANAWYRKHGYGYMAFEGDYDWLEKTLEYLKPIKPEWSEEDETCLEYALWCVMKTRHFVAKDACDLDACRCAERWLKSFPERFNLESKPEWSEKDEKQIRQIERIVKDAGCSQKLQEQIHNWFKSKEGKQ